LEPIQRSLRQKEMIENCFFDLDRNGIPRHQSLYFVALLKTAGQGIFQLVGIKRKIGVHSTRQRHGCLTEIAEPAKLRDGLKPIHQPVPVKGLTPRPQWA
jgi:hypothetical protein